MRRLLHDIMSGAYQPGGRIRELEVAQRLGVSRAPVRDALRMLEQDGLVAIEPRRGARVIDPQGGDIVELFELLSSVYGAVARFAARNARTSELREFSRRVAAVQRGVADGREVVELIDIIYQTGPQLGDCCGNPLAAEMLRKLGRKSYLSYRHLDRAPSRWLQQCATRLRVLDQALRARLEERSDKAARKLVLHAAKLALRGGRDTTGVAARRATTSPLQGKAGKLAGAQS